ncbi:MAG: glycosyltransferase family 4 protein [Actinobacteria bacterium]|nr:MAG: glycosyltransferase family 4 protein [Actinomycetota bacterium]
MPDGSVRLHGQVPSSVLATELEGAAVGLVPYRDSAFMRLAVSSKAMEYASLGIPVVGSDLPPLRVQLGDDGALFVTPGDASALAAGIRTILEDGEKAFAVAMSAQQHVGDWDWRAVERTYLDAVVGAQEAST